MAFSLNSRAPPAYNRGTKSSARAHGVLIMLAQLSARGLVLFALVLAAVAAEPAQKEEDPLPVDSTWKGKFTQIGKHPEASFVPEVQATLTVTKRDGDAVEVELREVGDALDITFQCRGRITRNADASLSLEFKSYSVKANPTASYYLTDVSYNAKIAGDTIKGTWKYVEKDQGIDVGGDYALVRE
jgi:hypothetical protein